MNNRTIYTHDLLLKMNWRHSARARRNAILYAFLTLIPALVMFIVDFAGKNVPFSFAVFLLTCSLIAFWALFRSRKAKIAQALEKQMRSNPGKIVSYRFEENHVLIDVTSMLAQSSYSFAYAYISDIIKIDEQSFYFYTKAVYFSHCMMKMASTTCFCTFIKKPNHSR
ncbi:MAG: hypothetical protein IJY20_01230 [Clostridia bacterium]|nr:hypothetical protein [Clostridia bacterium]